MTYRGIPQFSQGYPQISPQGVIGGSVSTKIKRNPIGRQPSNNIGIQSIPVSNNYAELAQQPPNIPPQQGSSIHVPQNAQQQTTVQYYVQPPPPPMQQPQPFNRIPNNPPVYSQYMQPGFSYPIYQTKNNGIPIVSNMPPVSNIQHNAPDQAILNQHQLQQSLVQTSQIHQMPPPVPTPQPQMQQYGQPQSHSQEQMIYQTPYSKTQIDYSQMQQPKMGMRQSTFESKPVLQMQNPPSQPNQQMLNFQQQAIQQQAIQQQTIQQQTIQQQQQQQIQQPIQRLEPISTVPLSKFIPDYNLPPAGPFNIIGRGNLPSINFVYSFS